jgi:hypothetical protein
VLDSQKPARGQDERNVAAGGGLDLDRLVRILGMLGSEHEGERANAGLLGTRMLRAAGLTWGDVAAAMHEREAAYATALELQVEVLRLEAENERLRTENSRNTTVAVWTEVGAGAGDFRAIARWALDLYAQGRLPWLAEKEISFLNSCARWRGPRLTAAQQPWFRDLTDRIVRRSGLTPPV